MPPSDPPDPWTTFTMPLRDPGAIPPAFDLTRFLASSLTFMSHLADVSVYLDSRRLTRLTKTAGPGTALPVPRGLSGRSALGLMSVTGIQSTRTSRRTLYTGTNPPLCFPALHIKAEVIRWVYSIGTEKPLPPAKQAKLAVPEHTGFFSALFKIGSGALTPQRAPTPLALVPAESVNMLETHETGVSLTIFGADVDVKLEKKMRDELHRSTKKNPPGKLRYDLIYVGFLLV
jgi:hypothetical protein